MYVFIDGTIAGIGFHVANIILFSKLGTSVTTIITVTRQMIVGILIGIKPILIQQIIELVLYTCVEAVAFFFCPGEWTSFSKIRNQKYDSS